MDQYLYLLGGGGGSFSAISSDMAWGQIYMIDSESGCAMTQISTGSQLFRRIVTSNIRQVIPVR